MQFSCLSVLLYFKLVCLGYRDNLQKTILFFGKMTLKYIFIFQLLRVSVYVFIGGRSRPQRLCAEISQILKSNVFFANMI